jgi:hypothetical protein
MHVCRGFGLHVVGLSLLLVAMPGVARAQSGEPSAQAERLQEKLDAVKGRLKLTPEQSEQLRPILTEELQQLRALREKYAADGDTSRRDKRRMAKELRDIRKDTDEKLKRILSKEQMAEMEQIRKEWRQEIRDRAAQR